MQKVALIGYSGHAFVVADTLLQCGYELIGYFEKKPTKSNPFNIPWLGFEKDSDFENKVHGINVFPAIGDNTIRAEILYLLAKYNLEIATVISPNANISKYASVDKGTIVCQGACINAFALVKRGVIINTGAIVEHECVIYEFAHIAPGAVLAGNVTIGEKSFIGANTVIKQGISIGKNVVLGAGSVVLKNIPDNEKWVGNPAKRI